MPSIVEIEEKLVHGIQNGDSSSLSRIMDRYSAYVSTIVWNILQGKLSKADAEEVVSDVFYTLWTQADKVQPRKLKGYLSVIARRRALNALRGRKHAAVPLEEDVVQLPIPGPEDESIRREEYAALRQTVDELPEPDRTIFIRHYFYYQKTSEIAKAMRINATTVKMKLKRGRERLQRELTEGGYFIG